MKRIILIFLPLMFLVARENFDEKDPREIIEKVRLYKLTEVLDLTDEQAAKLFPRLKEMRKNEQEFLRVRMDIILELKKLIKANAQAQEIEKVLDKFQEAQKKRIENQLREIRELKEILTPIQQAKFLIFQEEFEKEIRDLIREVKKRHRPRH